jgi:hypothetical protein
MSNIPWLFVIDTTPFKNLIEFMVATIISHDHYNQLISLLISEEAPDGAVESTKNVIVMCGSFGECKFFYKTM